MVLGREEGMTSSELNPVQLGMIRSARIPHMLRLHVRELDNKVTLEYDISGKKMLSQALKSDRLTLTEYYGLLLQIATAMNEARHYMLQPEQYMLHEDYLFLEGDLHLGTLYLCYVPLENVRGSGTGVQLALKDLMTRLLTNVTELKGGGVQALISYCGGEAFHLAGLKRLIIELLSCEDDTAGQTMRTEKSGMLSKYTSVHHETGGREQAVRSSKLEAESFQAIRQSKMETDRRSLIRNVGDKRNAKPATGEKDQRQEREESGERRSRFSAFALSSSSAPDEEEILEEEEQSSSPMRTYIVLACLLAAAATWRLLYLNHPSTLMLVLSGGITLLLAAVAYLGWQGKLQRLLSRSETWSDSDSLPLLESAELPSSRKSGWGIPRFEADPLSEVLTERSDRLATARGGQGREAESAEDWRWSFPDAAAGENPAGEPSLNIGGIGTGFGGSNLGSAEAMPFETASKQHDRERNAGSEEETALQIEEVAGAEDYYRQLSHSTRVLTSSDAGTVLLSAQDRNESLSATSPRAFIETTDPATGASQRIELVQQHFIIGRSPEVAQYVASAPGTSRAHVEVARENGGYIIKDLGSKNGTVLNGEPMVPYKEYELQEGDTFIIAGGRFSFKVSG